MFVCRSVRFHKIGQRRMFLGGSRSQCGIESERMHCFSYIRLGPKITSTPRPRILTSSSPIPTTTYDLDEYEIDPANRAYVEAWHAGRRRGDQDHVAGSAVEEPAAGELWQQHVYSRA